MAQSMAQTSYKKQVFIAVALSGLSIGVIMPVLAPLTRELGLADSQGGAVVSIGSAAMVACATLWGRFSDRRGRRAGFAVGFAGVALGYILFTTIVWYGLAGVLSGGVLFGLLVAARSVTGAFLPAVPAAAQAMIADHTSEQERSSGMALFGMAQGVGMVVGPAIGGVLAIGGLIYPFLMTIVLLLMGAAWAVLGMKGAGLPPSDSDPDSNTVSILWQNRLWLWLLAALIVFCAITTMQIATPYFIQDRLGVSGTAAARLLAAALVLVGVVLVITQTVQMVWLKWSALRLGFMGAISYIAAIGVLIMAQHPLHFFVAYGIAGIASGMLITAANTGASLAVGAAHQGRVGGYVSATQGIAAVTIPFGSTVLYEYGELLPFISVGIAMFVLAILLPGMVDGAD